MLRPAYRLTLGDEIIDTTVEPRASTAVDIDLSLDMDTPADGFTIIQGQVGGATPEPEDEVIIELGYQGGELELVLTGRVVDVVPGFETKRIVGLSTEDLLLRHHENETFEAMTAGDIARRMADGAGVDTDRIEAGLTFNAYVVDGRRPVGAHLGDLARLSGYDTYVNPSGELVFEEFSGQRTAHRLRYAEDVIDVSIHRTRPEARSVEVWGESPGSSRGTESWAWLTKDFEPWRGAAGRGDPVKVFERSAIRTAEAAIASATRTEAILDRSRVTGRVTIQGRPTVKLGELVRLEEFPVDELDGNYQVRAVDHRITKNGGFVTTVGFRTVGAVAP